MGRLQRAKPPRESVARGGVGHAVPIHNTAKCFPMAVYPIHLAACAVEAEDAVAAACVVREDACEEDNFEDDEGDDGDELDEADDGAVLGEGFRASVRGPAVQTHVDPPDDGHEDTDLE